jgi:glycosyltransferase involved in cell wall biosynthesis
VPDVKLRRPAFGSRVTFLYGGSISTDTGLDLFASALRTLARERPELAARMHFVVTGFGGGDKLAALARELEPSGFTLDVRQDTGPDEYKQILARADVGLSLKLPESAFNATTFPSKVIELASHGLLVLTTDISDIPLLFDRDTAAILPDAQAATLANLLAAIATDPERYAAIAAAGQRRIVERCSRRSVGRRLVEFLGVTPELSPR